MNREGRGQFNVRHPISQTYFEHPLCELPRSDPSSQVAPTLAPASPLQGGLEHLPFEWDTWAMPPDVSGQQDLHTRRGKACAGSRRLVEFHEWRPHEGAPEEGAVGTQARGPRGTRDDWGRRFLAVPELPSRSRCHLSHKEHTWPNP